MEQKVALISGGSGGIGRQIAMDFAKENITVILLARNEKKLKSVVDEITLSGGKADYILADVTDIKQIKEAFDRIGNKYGKLDILINCAGAGPVGGILEIEDSVWENSIDVKQLGYIKMTREAMRLMKQLKQGCIINIIGVFGKQPSSDFIVGSVTNAALIAFTKAAADEAAKSNIRINAINPGATNTELWADTVKEIASHSKMMPDEVNKNIAEMSPMKRLAEPSDISDTAMFLISDRAKFITGISINVDGGTYSGI